MLRAACMRVLEADDTKRAEKEQAEIRRAKTKGRR